MSRITREPLSPPALWSTPVAVQWQRCPVCEGRGTVSPDFYEQLGVGASTAREACRTCRGRTVIPPPGFWGGPRAGQARP